MKDKALTWLFVGLLAVWMGMVGPLVLANQAPAQDAAGKLQAENANLRAVLGDKLAELGACNKERGDLQQVQARVVKGDLVDRQALADALLKEIEARYAKANEGKTLDAKTGKVTYIKSADAGKGGS